MEVKTNIKIIETLAELKDCIQGTLSIKDDLKADLSSGNSTVEVLDSENLRNSTIDSLVYSATFSSKPEIIEACRFLIRASAHALGIFPSSIQDVYDAMGREELKGFTTPAINIRGFTYDFARTIQRASLKLKALPVIFEIARSEMGYTEQTPSEYATSIIAAAIKENYVGPLYIQGDHFQINAKKYAQDPETQIADIKALIDQALAAGFYNIDIDTSTLVDLSHDTLTEQQRVNFELGAEFTEYIRKNEPEGVTVSIGGEIGEVGFKNSTVEELIAYMDGFESSLKAKGDYKGPSKISVQTGTSHGGVPLPDGSVAEVNLDFETLEKLSEISRTRYGMSGAVQHGASTLPDELFDRFPQVTASEIHLATGFQNLVYDHPAFPAELKEEIYAHLRKAHAAEKKSDQTDEQFIYKTRKKGFGPFKRQMWDLDPELKSQIFTSLQEKFEFLFDKLGIQGKSSEISQVAKVDPVSLKLPTCLQNFENEELKAAV